jgi:hypothetical protein
MSSNIILCAACGEELTAPLFFDGKPYGWTCIKKVCPTFKKPKVIKTFIPDSEVLRVKKYYLADCYLVINNANQIVGDPASTERVEGGYIFFPPKKKGN